MSERQSRILPPLPAASSEVGRWLRALEESRARTKRLIEGVSQAELDWTLGVTGNSVGTLLYHIALIEADYLCIDILERERYLEEFDLVLPLAARQQDGHLTPVHGETLVAHLARLDLVRHRLLSVVSDMRDEEFDRVRYRPEWTYEITPAWTVHHLMQHEAEHRGEIATMLSLARAANGATLP